jgi:hypothetical protein
MDTNEHEFFEQKKTEGTEGFYANRENSNLLRASAFFRTLCASQRFAYFAYFAVLDFIPAVRFRPEPFFKSTALASINVY